MNSLTRRDVLAHQAHVPWPSQRQVEQDLLLCRAMAALFNDDFLRGQIAMRGGTLLHKVYLTPPLKGCDLRDAESGELIHVHLSSA